MADDQGLDPTDQPLLPQFLQNILSQHVPLLSVTFIFAVVGGRRGDADVDLVVMVVLQVDIDVEIGLLLLSWLTEVSLCEL